jgi:hypothetical protein
MQISGNIVLMLPILTFVRLSMRWFPRKSVLQRCISAITDVTWERINQRLLHRAQSAKVENGRMLRIDSTVTATPFHEPSDSSLLWDSVRTLVRYDMTLSRSFYCNSGNSNRTLFTLPTMHIPGEDCHTSLYPILCNRSAFSTRCASASLSPP